MKYIHAVRDAEGVINTVIVIGATSGTVKRLKPELLECNGGYVVLPVKKDWAKYLLSKMKFVKRKATTKKSAITVSNFKDNFLMDIKAVVVMEEVPGDMILNWDQTAVEYIPVSNWTMAIEGSKRIELIGDDKQQITATFAGTLIGQFLLVYEGKTTKCHPSIEFPNGWYVTHTANHWCNEETMIEYIKSVIVPYMDDTRERLGLSPAHIRLVILDHFKGQSTQKVLNLLEENHLMYILVPANCTNR